MNKIVNVSEKKNDGWHPIANGDYPDEDEVVQVTYIGYNDKKPHCDGFAYLHCGAWYWSSDDADVIVEITAWKPNCRAYQEEKEGL